MTRALGCDPANLVLLGLPSRADDEAGPSSSKATAQTEADATTNQTGVEESFGASTAESFFFGV